MTSHTLRRKLLLTALAWSVALVLSFPVLWLVLTSLKTETAAIARTPHLFVHPTLESYRSVQQRSDYLHFAANSLILSFASLRPPLDDLVRIQLYSRDDVSFSSIPQHSERVMTVFLQLDIDAQLPAGRTRGV